LTDLQKRTCEIRGVATGGAGDHAPQSSIEWIFLTEKLAKVRNTVLSTRNVLWAYVKNAPAAGASPQSPLGTSRCAPDHLVG